MKRPLCKNHKLPIMPSVLKHGNKTWGCWRCKHESEVASRKKHLKEKGLPFCKNHPEKHVNRSSWMISGYKKCRSCLRRKNSRAYERFRMENARRFKNYMKNPYNREHRKFAQIGRRRAKKLRETRL